MVKETNISINSDRLWDSLMTMAKIGPGIAGGNNRQTVTLEDGEARNLLQKWSEEAGMTMKVDELGSMFLKREGTDKNALPVVIGSHLDTQPTGGKYDGVLGVLAGLELLIDQEDKSSLVAIHDAARPCLQNEDLKTLMAYADEEIKEDGQGAFLAYQPNESVNQSSKEKISKILDRNKIWLSATPQVFILEDVFKALSEAINNEKTFSDEVSAVYSFYKSSIKPINSSRMNLKVTKKEDIALAELFLKSTGRL